MYQLLFENDIESLPLLVAKLYIIDVYHNGPKTPHE